MKKQSFILSLIGAVVVLAAIGAVIVYFRDELLYLFDTMRDKLYAMREEVLTPEEYDDYADVDNA